jgi:hypothetical protein
MLTVRTLFPADRTQRMGHQMHLPVLEIPRSEDLHALQHYELNADEATVFAAFEDAVEPLPLGSYPSQYHLAVEQAGKKFNLTPEQSVAFFIRTTLLTFEPPLAADPELIKTVQMAGYYGVQAIASLSDSGDFVPVIASESSAGERTLEEVTAAEPEEISKSGLGKLKDNAGGAVRAIFIWTGRTKVCGKDTDSLLLSLSVYGEVRQSLAIVIPYENGGPGKLAVLQPRFAAFAGPATPVYTALADAFVRGVHEHERGAAIWQEHMN